MVWIHCQREKYGIFFRYNMWLLKIATCINVTLTSMSFSLLFFRTNFLAFIHLLFFFNARMWRLCRCRRWLKGRDAAASACAGRQYWSQENYRLGCAGRQCPVIFRTHKFGAMSKCRCQMCLKWCHFGTTRYWNPIDLEMSSDACGWWGMTFGSGLTFFKKIFSKKDIWFRTSIKNRGLVQCKNRYLHCIQCNILYWSAENKRTLNLMREAERVEPARGGKYTI